MKVFFTAPFGGKTRYQKYYDLVLETLDLYSDDIISPEAGNYLDTITNKEKIKIKDVRKIHYEAIRRGIQLSDVVVMEISHPSFRLGHEATLAVQAKKPVLCLSINEDISLKIDSPYFFGAKYNVDNIDEIISNFLKRHSKNVLNNRFNMFLSTSQLAHIDEMAKRKNISSSAYLRWLIDKDRGVE